MGLFSRKPKMTEAEMAGNMVMSPLDGMVKPLSALKDGVFSEKMMGDGIVVAPMQGAKMVDFYAPASGELVTVFPTGHAYGIRTKDGVEVLLHIGVDTVNLEGKGFTKLVNQGQKVMAGDKIATVDVEYVRKNAPSADAILVITSGQTIMPTVSGGDIKAKAELFKVSM